MRSRPRCCLNIRGLTIVAIAMTITFSCGSCDVSVEAHDEGDHRNSTDVFDLPLGSQQPPPFRLLRTQ